MILFSKVIWRIEAMMGRQTADQAQLFYSFNLEERIPASHLLRRIDIFVTQVLADIHL